LQAICVYPFSGSKFAGAIRNLSAGNISEMKANPLPKLNENLPKFYIYLPNCQGLKLHSAVTFGVSQ
jgi:hypothetical protein